MGSGSGLDFVSNAPPIGRAREIYGMTFEAGETNTHGNTAGNINSYGIATFQGERIFYSTHEGIFRMNADGSDNIRISTLTGVGLNAVGEWLYFVSGNPATDDAVIYRMKTNGTEAQILLRGFNPEYVTVYDGWIYFSDATDKSKMSVFRVATDGKKLERLNNFESYFLNIVDDWIYFINGDSEWRVYRMRLDGKGTERVSDLESDFINVIGDWIVFIYEDEDERADMHIFAVNILDKDIKFRINGEASDGLNVAGDYIFYIEYDDNYSIYRIDFSGNNRAKLNDIVSMNINVAGDYIFYTGAISPSEIGVFRMKLDGSENVRVG